VTAGDTATSASVACPSVTTTAKNRLIVAICGHGIDADLARLTVSMTNSNLVSTSFLGDGSTVTGNGGGICAIAGVMPFKGATGTITGTLSESTEQGRMTIALKA
jgi:hypothetical protein